MSNLFHPPEFFNFRRQPVNLFHEFTDGLVLPKRAEIVSDGSFPRLNKRPHIADFDVGNFDRRAEIISARNQAQAFSEIFFSDFSCVRIQTVRIFFCARLRATKERTTMKEKTVFKSSEIAHLWANRKESGRCPSNMSFRDGGFYSYSTCIARRGVHKGTVYFIVDNASFSQSTNRHQGAVRSAIASGSVVFKINSGRRGQSLNLSPGELRDYYLSIWNQTPSTSRCAHKRAEDLIHRAHNLDEAIRVSKFFGLSCAKLEKIRNTIAATLEGEREKLIAHDDKLQQRREALEEKRRIQRETHEAASIAEAINRAEKLIAGERFPGLGKDEDCFGGTYSWNLDCYLDSRPDLKAGIAEWRKARDAKDQADWCAGLDIRASQTWPTCARIEGNEVVSNLGARIPLESALLGLKFVFAKRKKGWHRNGEKFPLGEYQLDAVNEFGIVAGCHTIKWNELERLATVLRAHEAKEVL